GVPVDVATAREKGFVDGIVEGDLVSAGVAHAKAMVGAPPTPTRNRRDRFTSALAFQNAIDTARAALGEAPTRAPAAILECVEAAPLLPFDQGLALERDLFLELRDTPEAKALRHAFLATREAVKPRPDLPAPSSVRRVAVVGGGQMGSAITVVCLDAELDVVLIEKPEERAAARERVTGIYDRAVSRGAMRETVRESRLERLTMGEAMDDVIHADLIIEAVPDDPDLKAQLFEALGSLAKPGAILASNTSYLDIDELAEASGRPEDVLGLHFFAPAHVQQAVEVVVGYQTSPSAEATAFAFAQKLRKKPVRAENSEGFIGNRILTAYRRAADYLLEDGASPYEIDAAMRAFGFKLGPYQVLDMTGLDISWARRQRHARAEDERYIRIGDALCEAGLLGRKVGQGYYAYDAEHPNGRENPAALTIIDAERAAKGVTPRRVRRAEMSRMCLLAMMNEGGRILDEGIAERAGDIDVVMLLGFGFPRHRGGPMKAAELSGLLPMLRELERLSQEDPFWMPSDALREAVKNGNRFSAVL
ncbi:MAG: 3-hydroxyacyl-CoA dehydrogenase NAD-binding domain-containing protein, partial [Pseudomonadota bacterium]